MASKDEQERDERLPPRTDLRLDPLTWYIYNHHSRLFTPAELAAARYRFFASKGMVVGPGVMREHLLGEKLPEIERAYPEVVARIRKEGVTGVMAAARDRILRDHADQVVLNRCPRCNALCRTPRAQQCLDCGHDWHSPEVRP